MVALLAGMYSFGYAQLDQVYVDALNAPKANEMVIGTLSNISVNSNCSTLIGDWYKVLLDIAKKRYPNQNIELRNMNLGRKDPGWLYGYWGPAECSIVRRIGREEQFYLSLSQAINKSLGNVRQGSRLAIDEVSVPYTMDRNAFKDQIIDMLLDKGYKVVAKEYLEKLYQEQQDQQSGIYNDRTIVQENNFSAVGYFLNIKLTESSVRVRVVNVSTGEYEGNATVNF